MKEQSARAAVQLSAYNEYDRIEKVFRVEINEEKGHAFLVWRDTGEEVVFEAQGYIAACQLPPNVKTEEFFAIRPIFSHNPSLLSEMAPPISPDRPWHTICFIILLCQTRYVNLTAYNVWPVAAMPYEQLDPHHTLQSALNGSRYVFTDDNVVQYRVMEADENDAVGQVTYKSVPPSVFRVGHLVDMGVNFRAVLGGDKFSVVGRMDSLLLVNRIGAKMLMEHHLAASASSVSTSQGVSAAPKKRKLSFSTQGEAESVRRKMQQLVLGDKQGGHHEDKDSMEVS